MDFNIFEENLFFQPFQNYNFVQNLSSLNSFNKSLLIRAFKLSMSLTKRRKKKVF